MTNQVSTISVEMQSSLQYFSEIAHKSNISNEDIEKLKKEGKTLLDEIEKSISSLNVSTQLYLKDISALIKKGIESPDNWNQLPSIENIRLNVSELKEISNIVKERINSIGVDIFALLAELLKFQRESNSIQADAKMIASKSKIVLIENEKITREQAAKQEFIAGMTTSIVQAVVGVFQIAMSTKGFINSSANQKNAAEIVKDNKALSNLKTEGDNLNKAAVKGQKEVNDLKGKLDEVKVSEQLKNKNEINNKISDINKNETKLKNEKPQFDENNEKLEQLIDAKNNKVRAKTEKISAEAQIMNSVGSVVNAAAACVGNTFKFNSKKDEINADFISKQGGLASETSQAYQEAIRNTQELMKDFIQKIQNIIQTIDSSVANIISKI